MKVAILGGSFDPIHYGHLKMAEFALSHLQVDEVWFMPTKSTPLKDRKLTPSADRLAMIQAAIEQYPQFKVCMLELERDQKSYTIDTLRKLHCLYDHEFYWLIGNDQLMQFDRWKEADVLVKLAHFVCLDRDGKLCDTSYPIQRMHMDPMPVSSSEIRIGNKLNYVPPKVLAYIYKHRLYVEDFVRTRVNAHRFAHSVSVAKLCEEFARCHGFDVDAAYYIGLFHDICKSMSKERMLPWMEILCPENIQYAVPVWHGFVASEVIDRIFYIQDRRVKHAIYHHVLGTSTDPYAMMVFCADKLDPLRDYDTSELTNLTKQDLYAGFLAVKKENEDYLKRGK